LKYWVLQHHAIYIISCDNIIWPFSQIMNRIGGGIVSVL